MAWPYIVDAPVFNSKLSDLKIDFESFAWVVANLDLTTFIHDELDLYP